MTVDKNTATLNFLMEYPDMQTNPLFVNFMNATDNDVQFMTDSNEVALNRKFIDGSVMKQYTFSILITRSITDLALVKDGVLSENIDDLADIQAFMDWINEQGDNHNYPDFGENCVIEEMHTTAENPSIDGINDEVSPALALYSMEIRIDYIDYSKVIWS